MAENYTTYSDSNDQNSDLTVDATSISVDVMRKDANCYLADDKGSGHFNGAAFEHLVDVIQSAGGNGAEVHFWALANTAAGSQPIDDASGDCIFAMLLNVGGASSPRLYVVEINAGSFSNSSGLVLSQGTQYYMSVRFDPGAGANGTLYCDAFSDSGRTTLVGTESLALTLSSFSFQYVFAVQGKDESSNAAGWSGTIANLDLQDSGTTETVSISGSVTPTGGLIVQPIKALSGGDTAVGAVANLPEIVKAGADTPIGELVKVPSIVLGNDSPAVFYSYDGSSRVLRDAALTGASDGKLGCGSVWFRTTDSVNDQILAVILNARLRISIMSNKFEILGRNSAGSDILTITSTTSVNDGADYHVMWSYDLATPGSLQLRLNGADDKNAGLDVRVDDDIHYSNTDFGIGAFLGGLSPFTGAIGQCYLNFADAPNLASVGGRFYANGGPVDLGADGSRPTGNQPIVFMNSTAGPLVNLGTGGDMQTEVGDVALDTSSTNPGNFVPSGSLTSIIAALLDVSGGMTSSGDLDNLQAVSKDGSDTPTGGVLFEVSKILAGSDTPTGALVQEAQKVLSGAVSPSAAVLFQTEGVDFAGETSPTGALVNTPDVVLAGQDTPEGTASLTTALTVNASGEVTPVGTLVKLPSHSVSGADTPTGALVNEPLIALAGAMTPTGALSNIAVVTLDLAGEVTPIGALVNVPEVAFAGAVTGVGGLVLEPDKLLAGADTPSGALDTTAVQVLSVSGSDTPTGLVTHLVPITLSGADTPTGDLELEAQKVFGGSISAAGILTARRVLTEVLSGEDTPTGDVQLSASAKLISKAGSMTSSGALVRTPILVRGGAVTPSGDLVNEIAKALAGEDTPTGTADLVAVVLLSTVGAVSPSGALTTVTLVDVPEDVRLEDIRLRVAWIQNLTLKG